MTNHDDHDYMSDADARLMQKISERVEEAYGCWIWTLTPNEKGGCVYPFEGKVYTVPRVLWQALHPDVVLGQRKLVRTCHTRLCVDPTHWELYMKEGEESEESEMRVPSVIRTKQTLLDAKIKAEQERLRVKGEQEAFKLEERRRQREAEEKRREERAEERRIRREEDEERRKLDRQERRREANELKIAEEERRQTRQLELEAARQERLRVATEVKTRAQAEKLALAVQKATVLAEQKKEEITQRAHLRAEALAKIEVRKKESHVEKELERVAKKKAAEEEKRLKKIKARMCNPKTMHPVPDLGPPTGRKRYSIVDSSTREVVWAKDNATAQEDLDRDILEAERIKAGVWKPEEAHAISVPRLPDGCDFFEELAAVTDFDLQARLAYEEIHKPSPSEYGSFEDLLKDLT